MRCEAVSPPLLLLPPPPAAQPRPQRPLARALLCGLAGRSNRWCFHCILQPRLLNRATAAILGRRSVARRRLPGCCCCCWLLRLRVSGCFGGGGGGLRLLLDPLPRRLAQRRRRCALLLTLRQQQDVLLGTLGIASVVQSYSAGCPCRPCGGHCMPMHFATPRLRGLHQRRTAVVTGCGLLHSCCRSPIPIRRCHSPAARLQPPAPPLLRPPSLCHWRKPLHQPPQHPQRPDPLRSAAAAALAACSRKMKVDVQQ